MNYSNKFTKTISVTSGKGGVGKTSFVCNVAAYLAGQGHHVLILDGDLGMANVDVFFGVRPHVYIDQVLRGEKLLEEAVFSIEPNIDLIPGGSGIYELQNINYFQKKLLLDQVSQLENKYDYMLIDTAPGIADNVLYLNTAVQEIMVILTPDPSSLTDAYALIKVLHERHKENKFSIVCNLVHDEYEALKIYKRLSDVCSKFLCVSLDYQGYIPLDQKLREATKQQQLIVDINPRSPSSIAFRNIVGKINNHGHLAQPKGGMQFFFEQMIKTAC
ncbi:MAG: MinD/ParA family protein [Bdellovibrionales bacterium]|nr:MinD/ParA family protein [Bdellovibrionales bacterium]